MFHGVVDQCLEETVSRGLGKVQRAVVAALQPALGQTDLRTLVIDVIHPFVPTRHRDREWHYARYQRRSRDHRAEYMAAWWAVKTLARRRLVTTPLWRPSGDLA